MTNFKQLIENSLNTSLNENEEYNTRYISTYPIHHSYSESGKTRFKHMADGHKVNVDYSKDGDHEFMVLRGQRNNVKKVLQKHHNTEMNMHCD